MHFTQVSEQQRQEVAEDRVGEDRVGEGDISLQVTKLQKWLGPDQEQSITHRFRGSESRLKILGLDRN